MNREILFRGKRIDTGEWVEGNLIVGNKTDSTIILPKRCDWIHDYVVVIPETVGQFTGLFDKNRKRIFEGDIISKKRKKDPNNFASEYIHNPDYYSVVIFMDGAFMTDDSNTLIEYINDYNRNVVAEIISNIHDNPELLEGGEPCTT